MRKVGYTQPAVRALRHRRDLRRLADERVARQQERRLVVVARRQPHRQPRPAADLRDPPPEQRRRQAAPARRSPARCSTRTTPAAPWYILGTGTEYHTMQDHAKAQARLRHHADRPRDLHRSASGRTRPTTRRSRTCAMRAGNAGLQRRRSTSTAWRTPVAGAHRRRLRRDPREPDAPHARPVGEEPHPGRVRLGGRPPACTTTARTTSARTRRPTRCPTPRRRRRHAADGSGTGWNTLALKGIWRPQRHRGRAHRRLRRPARQLQAARTSRRTSPATGSTTARGRWPATSAARPSSQRSTAQDAWALRAALEDRARARAEHWQRRRRADDVLGRRSRPCTYPSRRENYLSPKAALSYQARADMVLKASARPRGAHADGGRAVRRDVDDQLAVHQRPEPEAREVVDHRADRREGSRQRRRCA